MFSIQALTNHCIDKRNLDISMYLDQLQYLLDETFVVVQNVQWSTVVLETVNIAESHAFHLHPHNRRHIMGPYLSPQNV